MNDQSNTVPNDSEDAQEATESKKAVIDDKPSILYEANKKAFEDRMTPAFSAELGYANTMALSEKTVDFLVKLSKSNADYASIATKFSTLLNEVKEEEETYYKTSRKHVIEEDPETPKVSEDDEDTEAGSEAAASETDSDEASNSEDAASTTSRRFKGDIDGEKSIEDDWGADLPEETDSQPETSDGTKEAPPAD